MTHRPKTAALLAYADGLLSDAGRARLERHLARCETCRRELAAMRLYERMAQDARETPVPEVDYGRMEVTLAREAERISQRIRVVKRRRPWAAAAVLAAAAALALWVAWPSERREVASGETEAPAPRELAAPDEPAPPAESPLLSPVVTLAVGSAARIESDGPVPLEAGEVLREGQALRIGEDGALHVRLADGTGFAAAAGTELTIARAREDAVELALSAGRIDNTVARLASGSTYTVLCAGYRIEVRGTRFVVSFVDGVVGVDVAEGGVVVRNDDAEPVELSAPARWRSEGSAEGEPEIVAPRGLEAASGALSPVTIAHGELVRWEIDGTSFAGRGPVRLLFRDGEHEVRGWDRRGRLHTALVPVRGAAVAIEPSALVPEGPRMRPGHLPPEEITRVLRRANATERVRACYERTLRDHPEVYGRLRVRVSVGVMGDVQRVSVQGAAASEATQLSECIERVASQWTFPPPGGPVTFELPLAFSSRP